MSRIITAMIDIVIAMIFLLPVTFINNKFIFKNKRNSFLYLIFSAYLVAIYSLVGLPNVLYLRMDFTYNFVPLVGILSDLSNAILNVILFIPFGFMLPVFWSSYRSLKHTLIFGLCTTLLIEVLQIFTFRATDINDIITNVTGTLIGYLIAKCVTKNFTHYRVTDSRPKDVVLVCTTVMLGMFFIQPLITSLIYR